MRHTLLWQSFKSPLAAAPAAAAMLSLIKVPQVLTINQVPKVSIHIDVSALLAAKADPFGKISPILVQIVYRSSNLTYRLTCHSDINTNASVLKLQSVFLKASYFTLVKPLFLKECKQNLLHGNLNCDFCLHSFKKNQISSSQIISFTVIKKKSCLYCV